MKKFKKALVLLICAVILASIFTVPVFAETVSASDVPTIPELVSTIISWRFRPFFWLVNLFIRLVTGLPLIPGLSS